jgi:hypothetical protein
MGAKPAGSSGRRTWTSCGNGSVVGESRLLRHAGTQKTLVTSKLVDAPVPTEVRGKAPIKKGAQGPTPAKDPDGKRKSFAKIMSENPKAIFNLFGIGS